MPTRFYLTTASAPYTPATIRGAWDDTAGAVTRAIAQYPLDGGTITTVARAETNVSATYDVLLYRGVSYPLVGAVISGTVNVVLGVLESNAAADMYWHIHMYVTTGDSDTVRFTLLNDYVENTTNEFGITVATCGLALQAAQAYGNTITAGDRLVIEIGYISREASATSRTGTLYYGTKNSTTGRYLSDLAVAGDPTLAAGWIEFSDALLEDTTANEVRETQLLVKVLSANTPAIRETQTLAKVLSANTPAIRETQTLVKVLSANTPAIRETQTLVKVLSANTPVIRASQVMVKVLRSTAVGIEGAGAASFSFSADGAGLFTLAEPGSYSIFKSRIIKAAV